MLHLFNLISIKNNKLGLPNSFLKNTQHRAFGWKSKAVIVHHGSIGARKFSNSAPSYMDEADRVLNQAKKLHEDMKNWYKKYLEEKEKLKNRPISPDFEASPSLTIIPKEKPKSHFLENMESKTSDWLDSQDKLLINTNDQNQKLYDKLNLSDVDKLKIQDKYNQEREEASMKLDAAYNECIKNHSEVSVSFLNTRISSEASFFKRMMRIFKKEENEIENKLMQIPNFPKAEHEKEMSKWREEHGKAIHEHRQNKQKLQEEINSKLESGIELAVSLEQETGPAFPEDDS